MCNDNSKLKNDGVGNRTLCRVKRIKLKDGASPLCWKNWDNYKVNTVNAQYVEYVEFERFPDNGKIRSTKAAISAFEEELANDDDSNRLAELEKLQEKLQTMKQSQCFKLSLGGLYGIQLVTDK